MNYCIGKKYEKNIILIIIFNIIGWGLYLTWFQPWEHSFWYNIDKKVFYYFNNLAAANKFVLYIVAITNIRIFDLVSFICMIYLMYRVYKISLPEKKRHIFCIGIAIVISVIIVKQINCFFDFSRISPTFFFNNALHIAAASGLPTKDASHSCFPSDHAMVLMIFCSYMLKYFNYKTFLMSMAVFLIFDAPRIMIGAHWFTDTMLGALPITMIVMSCLLLTPIIDLLLKYLQNKIPLRYFC